MIKKCLILLLCQLIKTHSFMESVGQCCHQNISSHSCDLSTDSQSISSYKACWTDHRSVRMIVVTQKSQALTICEQIREMMQISVEKMLKSRKTEAKQKKKNTSIIFGYNSFREDVRFSLNDIIILVSNCQHGTLLLRKFKDC